MRYRFTAIFILITLLFSSSYAIFPSQAANGNLFFSEYIEGSSLNKAIEIYNGTGSTIDLAAGGYSLEIYFNGSASPGTTVALAGTVADGDVFVVADDGASASILAQTDLASNRSFFNGDDAVVLRKGTAIIDVIGQIGADPGSEWGTGLTSTGNNTLRRLPNVCSGDTNGSDTFDPAFEWDGFATDTFDGLGAHSANCDGAIDPKINEFSVSTTGTDVEYIELIGAPSTDYSGLSILEIEGDSTGAGTIDEVIPVGTTDSSGLWLVTLAANAIENGTVSLLLVQNFSGAQGDDLDTDNDGALKHTPWDAVIDEVAVHDGGSSDRTYAIPVLGRNYDGVSSFAPGGASRIPDGFDTESAIDWVRNDFDLFGIPGYAGSPLLGEAVNTPGAPNAVITVPTDPVGICGDPATLIHNIQGNGPVSPDVGSIREVEAVVTATFQGANQIGGYFIQEEDSDVDSDALTSEGLRVFDNANTPNVGDVIRIRGAVAEFFSRTDLTNIASYAVCGSGTATAATVALPVDNVNDLEAYEDMLVTFPQDLYISEFFNFDRYGEIVLSVDRQQQPTATFDPGTPEAAALALANSLSRITMDDGRGNQNPDPAIHPNGAIFDLTNRFRGGDMVTNVTGVLDYNFGLYKIQPTQGADYTAMNLRQDLPNDVGGGLKVASFNVLNYFTTLDYPSGDPLDNMCGPLQNQGCRGADDAEEFTRQKAKIIAAIAAIDADVVGLIEIENHPGDVPTADLVTGLNDAMGAGTYDYIATGAIGSDAIRQAFIYKPASVSLVGGYAVLDSTVDPRFVDTRNRPALAQTFMDNTSGGVFTAVVNHLKSKGSACGPGDDDPEAGSCNLTRTLAAQALVDWLASDPTGSGDADFLIIGDLNSYDKEDPIDVLAAGGYSDLLYQYIGEDAYTYVFDGQLGYLDYALAGPGLIDEVTGVTAWHINSDEPDILDYDTSFKQDAQDALYESNAFRASDHDPVIVGMAVCDEIAPTISVSVTPDTLWPANHKYVDVTATVTASDNFDLNPTVTLLSVTSNEPDNGQDDGDTVEDIVIVDDTTFKLRAERAGIGSGRTYTITYEVSDACGNTATATATVFIPLSQGK